MQEHEERVVAGMTCGDVLAVLSDFLDGDLDPAKRQRVMEHLRGCDWCERFGGRFSEVVGSLRRELAEPAPLNAEVAGRLRSRIESIAAPPQELRRCRECGTVFEPDVADRDPNGQPRCPQCFLSSSDEVRDVDQDEMVIRQSTPFRCGYKA
jgi:hypothetical protein